ncbi:MAG: DNA-binding transcriptional LysR family regulator [Francisellaceae bacterium]|jgi:DNA-binding transcriptional LysR family regulator
MSKDLMEGISYFNEVIECGSILKAAESLGVTTNTFRKKISMLEDHLGISLFRRTSAGAKISDEGMEFHSNILPSWMKIQNTIANCKQGDSKRTIRMICPAGVSEDIARYILKPLKDEYPELTIELSTFTYSYVYQFGIRAKHIFSQYDFIIMNDFLLNLIDHDNWKILYKYENDVQVYTTKAYLDQLDFEPTEGSLLKMDAISNSWDQKPYWKLGPKNENKFEVKINPSYYIDLRAQKTLLLQQNVGIALLDTFVPHRYPNCSHIIKILPELYSSPNVLYALLDNNYIDPYGYTKSITAQMKKIAETYKISVTNCDSENIN